MNGGLFAQRPWFFPMALNGFSTDRQTCACLNMIGWIPDGVLIMDKMYERGEGRAIRCMVSGIYFPESRIRQLADGRYVGDYIVRESVVEGESDDDPFIQT